MSVPSSLPAQRSLLLKILLGLGFGSGLDQRQQGRKTYGSLSELHIAILMAVLTDKTITLLNLSVKVMSILGDADFQAYGKHRDQDLQCILSMHFGLHSICIAYRRV